MIPAIIILSLLVMAETLLIFWLFGVLKNTFNIVQDLSDMAKGKIPKGYKEAYDGKYYPATVLAKIIFESPQNMTITDFSMYESKRIVGFTIYTNETIREYYGDAANEISDEELKERFQDKTAIFKDVIVYSPIEGVWTWKQS